MPSMQQMMEITDEVSPASALPYAFFAGVLYATAVLESSAKSSADTAPSHALPSAAANPRRSIRRVVASSSSTSRLSTDSTAPTSASPEPADGLGDAALHLKRMVEENSNVGRQSASVLLTMAVSIHKHDDKAWRNLMTKLSTEIIAKRSELNSAQGRADDLERLLEEAGWAEHEIDQGYLDDPEEDYEASNCSDDDTKPKAESSPAFSSPAEPPRAYVAPTPRLSREPMRPTRLFANVGTSYSWLRGGPRAADSEEEDQSEEEAKPLVRESRRVVQEVEVEQLTAREMVEARIDALKRMNQEVEGKGQKTTAERPKKRRK